MNSLNEIQAENLKVNVTAIRLLVAKMECRGKMEKLRIHQTSQRNFARLYSSVCPRLYNRKKLLSTDFFIFSLMNLAHVCYGVIRQGTLASQLTAFLLLEKKKGEHRLFDTRSF